MKTETTIGNYRVVSCIGQGGMGVVYRGHHTSLPRDVAIKSIKANTGSDLRRLKLRFDKEAYIQSQLDHPNIVKIYDYIVDEQTYYIIMEYVEGRSLADLCSTSECPLPIARALPIFEEILKAVAYAHEFTYVDQDGSSHRGLIHRDLKSANILIMPDDRVKITDFGIVKLVGADNTDTFGTVYGSPQYVSPEQAEGVPVNQKSDIYSLGIILYEMLTGAPPFGGANGPATRTEVLRAHVHRPPRPPSGANPEISSNLESAILRALKKNPAERFESAQEFLHAIHEISEREIVPQSIAEKPKAEGSSDVPTRNELTSSTNRLSYVTQPILSSSCAACGTELTGFEEFCPVCHSDVSASPATGKLTREGKDASARNRTIGIWIAVGILLLVVVPLFIFSTYRDKAAHKSTSETAPPEVTAPSAEPSNDTPAGLIELQPEHIAVDSSYDGYNAAPLTDGITDVRRIAAMKYNKGNWVSAETPLPHWIEIDLGKTTRVGAMYVYWGFDHGRFMPSRHVELQAPDDSGSWDSPRTLSIVEPGKDYDRTAFEFKPVMTSRLRILQPTQTGPPGRPFSMWVREIKVYGVSNTSSP